jgi:hypothetical protein
MRLILWIFCPLFTIAQQNVGIGTTTPEARLHVRSTQWIKAIFENDAGQARGYIGTDANGTVTIASNAFWTGNAWSYPNAGSSMYLLMHRVNSRFEFRVRPDGGSEITPMVVGVNGRVGIGTTSPEQILSIGGGMNIDHNNQNTGEAANMLGFGSISGEGIGSKRTVGTGQYGLDFYTGFTNRMHISNTGNIGIGTNNPLATLDILVGGGRSFLFKNDLVPTLELASKNVNDGLAGVMRLRNAIEVFPSANGQRAGKVDVRNKQGNPTIILDGDNGFISAANFPNYNQKISGYYPLNFIPVGIVNSTMTDITVEFPGPGFAFIEAGVNGYFQEMTGITNADMEIKLDEYTPANSYVTTLQKINMLSGAYASPTIYYEAQIPGKVSRRYKLVLYKNGPGPGNHIVGPGFIKVWYYPAKLPAS